MLDVARAKHLGDRDALERLSSAARATEQMHARAGLSAQTSTAGAEFAPPGWYVENYVAYARPGRTAGQRRE